MTIPAVLFGIFISLFIGASFHLWKDGGFGRLILYLFLSGIGFWTGHLLADVLKINFLSLGPLHLGFALIACALFLGVGYWLSLVSKPFEK